MIDFLIKARHVSFAAALLALVLLLLFGQHVTYEQSIQSFFAEDDPDIVNYRAASELFGNDNLLFICYDDPKLLTRQGMDRVHELAEAVGPRAVSGISEVQSLDAMPEFWQIDDALLASARSASRRRPSFLNTLQGGFNVLLKTRGGRTIGDAVRSADPKALRDLARHITAHPLIRGTLISASGTATAVVARLRPTVEYDMKATVTEVRTAADAFARRHGLERPAVVGPPVLLADGFANIERDGQRLSLLGMFLISLVTLTAVRSVWWAAVPLVAGWVVWRATEAILAALGLKLSLSGGPLVAQIIVLTMPAASHLAIHFRDDCRRETDHRQAARLTLAAVSRPIIWCAITGAIGYGALLTSTLVPVRQFGAVLGACTLVAALLTMMISPFAMLPPIRLEMPVCAGTTSPAQGAMHGLTAWVLRHAGLVVLVGLAVVIPLSVGMVRLRYESNYINVFRQDSRVVRDYHFVESRLGGIGLFELVVPLPGKPGSIEPETLAALRSFDNRLAGMRWEGAPAVSYVLSLATVLDPDGRLAAEPEAVQRQAMKTKLDLIAASPQADLLGGFWNAKKGMARILVRIPEQQPAASKEATFRTARDLARAQFGPRSFHTGLSFLMTRTTRGVIATQWSTTLWSAGGILLMLTIALRGPRLAILAMLPSTLAIGLVLGLMGWVGVKLDIATALVASVALGLSVDDTFHCLLQFRRHRAERSFEESLFDSYDVTGPGVMLSSLAVAVGFVALWFSEFVPFANFGVMVCIATAGSSLGNLVLLPACLVVGERLRARARGREVAVGS